MRSIPVNNQVNRQQIVVNHQSHSMGNLQDQQGDIAVKKIKDYSYCMNDKLGLGMTSKVFKGKNDTTGQKVALKVIDINQTDQLSRNLINQEINTLEKIKNFKGTQNLLTMQEVLKTRNHLYIITEFCEGKDMAKILRQKKSMSQTQAQSVMKQLINGYRQLYSLGIIHRDLKLSNVFVTQGRIKLADFGFAISEEKCDLSMGYNVGTPHYMAPETLRFNKYSVKADMWSLGIIAYEIIYGKPPYKDKIDSKLYDLVHTVPIQSLFDPSIPLSVEYKTFITQCLQVDPNVRISPQRMFNYIWPLAHNFVEGFQEEVKAPEVIKVPGNNYAVYRNSNKQISYESTKIDIDDFKVDRSMPTQSAVIGQLNYCKFLVKLYQQLKMQNNQAFSPLLSELGITIKLIQKKLAEKVRTDKNIFQTPDFAQYAESADWQNLKQVIIRYDIEFRSKLSGEPPISKLSKVPDSPVLSILISTMKAQLPNNWRLLEKLIIYYEIREPAKKLDLVNFSLAIDFNRLFKDLSLPDEAFNCEAQISSLMGRMSKLGL